MSHVYLHPMRLHTIHTGNFKLDGGAMFGVVPHQLWSRTNPLMPKICAHGRCVRCWWKSNRRLLVDCGIGDKQSEKFFSHYHLHGDNSWIAACAAGFAREDITDVFLTHLHFDHVGGRAQTSRWHARPRLPNATYWSNEAHWQWAVEPNAREKASFPRTSCPCKRAASCAWFHARGGSRQCPRIQGWDIFFADGHTESQMIPLLRHARQAKPWHSWRTCFLSTGHIPLAYVMGYDTRPLLTLEEKKPVPRCRGRREWVLFLEHDAVHVACTVRIQKKACAFAMLRLRGTN